METIKTMENMENAENTETEQYGSGTIDDPIKISTDLGVSVANAIQLPNITRPSANTSFYILFDAIVSNVASGSTAFNIEFRDNNYLFVLSGTPSRIVRTQLLNPQNKMFRLDVNDTYRVYNVEEYIPELPFYAGTSQAKEIYAGTSKVKAIYRGTTEIWPNADVPQIKGILVGAGNGYHAVLSADGTQVLEQGSFLMGGSESSTYSITVSMQLDNKNILLAGSNLPLPNQMANAVNRFSIVNNEATAIVDGPIIDIISSLSVSRRPSKITKMSNGNLFVCMQTIYAILAPNGIDVIYSTPPQSSLLYSTAEILQDNKILVIGQTTYSILSADGQTIIQTFDLPTIFATLESASYISFKMSNGKIFVGSATGKYVIFSSSGVIEHNGTTTSTGYIYSGTNLNNGNLVIGSQSNGYAILSADGQSVIKDFSTTDVPVRIMTCLVLPNGNVFVGGASGGYAILSADGLSVVLPLKNDIVGTNTINTAIII